MGNSSSIKLELSDKSSIMKLGVVYIGFCFIYLVIDDAPIVYVNVVSGDSRVISPYAFLYVRTFFLCIVGKSQREYR